MKYLILILIVFSILTGCSILNNKSTNKSQKDIPIETQSGVIFKSAGFIMIPTEKAEALTGKKYDADSKYIEAYCGDFFWKYLKDQIFSGSKIHIDFLAEIIDVMDLNHYDSYLQGNFNKGLRGEKIFSSLLKRANTKDCFKNNYSHAHQTVFNESLVMPLMKIMSYMIDSIGNHENVNDFINEYWEVNKYTIIKKDYDCDGESDHYYYFKPLKEAYDEGEVILKNFNEN